MVGLVCSVGEPLFAALGNLMHTVRRLHNLGESLLLAPGTGKLN